MNPTSPYLSFPLTSSVEQAFPILTPEQIARIAAHGRVRSVQTGEQLQEAGAQAARLFVILVGRLEVFRPTQAGEVLMATLLPGHFTGEVTLLSGRPTFGHIRAAEPGEVIEVDREQLMALVQTDSELSDLLMRAFLLRRMETIRQGIGDVVLIGSSHSAGTLRIKEFLTRNGHPYSYIDLERDDGVEEMLERFHVAAEDVPVVIGRGKVVLRNPSLAQIVEVLGFNEAINQTRLRDLVIVGAGPAGLAAAVYAASEGLDVLVLEAISPGGQAASSSMIENYLGFPMGISGKKLAAMAYTQAQKFGAELAIAQGARRLDSERRPYAVEIENGARVPARAILIATGAHYRRLALENLSQFEGAGVYYGATFLEAQLCRGEELIVVGGGNSAGQAAVFLAQNARRVHVLIRSGGLAESMSRYLIRRIEENPAITLRTHTEIVGLEGDGQLECVHWRDNRTGTLETHPIGHVFVMTGASPNTEWLEECVALDAKGFVKTGPDLSADDLAAARWPLARTPHLLETSRPGVFAVGDVRSGNVKRVASAVGEGSIAVSFVHQALQE